MGNNMPHVIVKFNLLMSTEHNVQLRLMGVSLVIYIYLYIYKVI